MLQWGFFGISIVLKGPLTWSYSFYSWWKQQISVKGHFLSEDRQLTNHRQLKVALLVNGQTNIFKSYENFESLKVVAQKLSAPRSFVFWGQNSRYSLNFEARKNFKNLNSWKKYWIQNTNGCGALNFWATTFKLSNFS